MLHDPRVSCDLDGGDVMANMCVAQVTLQTLRPGQQSNINPGAEEDACWHATSISPDSAVPNSMIRSTQPTPGERESTFYTSHAARGI